jgi:hypothetical protein
MSGLLFRLYHDTGISAWVCRITGYHSCKTASYRDVSCTRCPYIGPRTDWTPR